MKMPNLLSLVHKETHPFQVKNASDENHFFVDEEAFPERYY